ncbi:MAG: T9SS type A sorting domain-containing protein [Bacteroidota bacterium]
MRRTLLVTMVTSLLLWIAATDVHAQVKEVLLRCEADVTLLKDFPDINAGYDLNNQLCNFDSVGPLGGTNSPEEAWVRWDLGAIESEIGEGEEILYVEAVFRVSWNSDVPEIAQGFHALHLDDSFDFWNEGNGVSGDGGAVDNLDGLTWNKAKGINDFEDAVFHDTLYSKQQAKILPNKEYIPVLDAVQKELSGEGNKLFTLRMVPYHNSIEDRKRWLGFISLQSPAANWALEVDDEGYPLHAPQLKFYIGKHQEKFSDHGRMGVISNYSVKPDDFGYWMVADDEGDAKMQLMKKTTVDQETWNPAALAVFNDAEFQDFEISVKAKLTDTTQTGVLIPFNDFIMAFGYVDPDNFSYYAFYGNDESGTFQVVDGIRKRVGDAKPMPALSDALYHSYKMTRTGSTVTVFIDDVEYQSINNDSLNVAGKVGFGSHNDAVFFDDFFEKDYGVGVADLTSAALSIYPNPVSSELVIESTRGIDAYRLMDITGKLILSGHNRSSGQTVLDISEVPDGLYILFTDIAGNHSSHKIIKQ